MTKDIILQDVFVSMFQNFVDFWWSFPIIILSYLLFYFFTHPDKIAIWSSLIASLFEKLSKRSARHSVASDIQGRISSYIKNNHADGILPYGLKFRWIKNDNFSSYVEKDDVIVIMDYHNNNARNFVNAIRQYTSQAFLPVIRHELPSEILTAAELTIQEKIIREKRPDALNIFNEEILSGQIDNNDEIKLFYDEFTQLNIFGYFDNIFLTEFIFTGKRLHELDLNQKTNEIKNFLTFLRNMENENFPLDYHGDVFCVQIILVAKPFIKQTHGTAPYIKRAERAYSEKANSLYVTGREPNMDFVDEIIEEITEKKIGTMEWNRNYKTLDKKKKKRNAKIALFRL